MTDPTRCRCRNPICEKQHSASGPVVVRMDFLTAFHALGALHRWEAELQAAPDDEARAANVFVKRGIADLEVALFGRAEGIVVDDWREVQARLLAEAGS